MPFQSKAQSVFMHINHPDIAARWDAEHGTSYIKKLPEKAKVDGGAIQRRAERQATKPASGG